MKRTIAVFLILCILSIFVYAEEDEDTAIYRVNGRLLTEMTIQEIYDFEDALVSALSVKFNEDFEVGPNGELLGLYVINKSTRKFHYPYCYSALQIVPEKRVFIREAPNELVKQGYRACGTCNPHVNTN